MTWNFEYLDGLRVVPLRRCRLFVTSASGTGASGTGATVLFVHGGFHGAWCWAPFLEMFTRAGIKAAAVDLCGHGGQPPPDNFIALGMRDMAADIVEAARHLTGEIVLAGHSLGALAVMTAAQTIGPRGLVLLGPAPPANVKDIRLLPPFSIDTAVAPPSSERARKWFLGGYNGQDIAPYVARLCPESPAFLNGLYTRGIAVDPTWIKGPTLCLSGGKDDTALHRAGQDESVSAFYGAELHTLPAAGHCMMLDDSRTDAAATITAWLHRNQLA